MARSLKGARQTKVSFFLPLEDRDESSLLRSFRDDARRLDDMLDDTCEILNMNRTGDGFADFIVLTDLSDKQLAEELNELKLHGTLKVEEEQHEEMESA